MDELRIELIRRTLEIQYEGTLQELLGSIDELESFYRSRQEFAIKEHHRILDEIKAKLQDD